MKTTNNFLKLLVLAFAITFASCGSNEADSLDCGNSAWSKSVETELNAWLTATQVYSQDPSSFNCQNFKAKGLLYVKALIEIKSCVPSSALADFEKALEEAEEEINEFSC